MRVPFEENEDLEPYLMSAAAFLRDASRTQEAEAIESAIRSYKATARHSMERESKLAEAERVALSEPNTAKRRARFVKELGITLDPNPAPDDMVMFLYSELTGGSSCSWGFEGSPRDLWAAIQHIGGLCDRSEHTVRDILIRTRKAGLHSMDVPQGER